MCHHAMAPQRGDVAVVNLQCSRAKGVSSFPFFAEGRGVPVACFAPSGQVLRIEIARACLLNASSIHRTQLYF